MEVIVILFFNLINFNCFFFQFQEMAMAVARAIGIE